MRLMETNSKEWKRARGLLTQAATKHDDCIRRIINNTPHYIVLEGGHLGYTYDLTERKLFVHGKVSRNAGGSIAVGTLKKLEDACRQWQETIESEETN
ncbi:hypothetical protein COM97_27215 [Bacillus thuringiensis]|nr:hypothetical protein COM97_27215 [Bacillus thuringiensis]